MSTDLQDFLPQPTQVKLADGKSYTFSELHLNAQSAIQKRFGIKLMSEQLKKDERGGVVKGLDGKPLNISGVELLFDMCRDDPDTLQFVAWQLMLKHHRNLTEEDVGYLITLANFVTVLTTIIGSVLNSLPIPDEKKKEARESLALIQVSNGN